MDADLVMTIGLVFGVLAIPAVVGAITEGRAPRLAALLFLVSAGGIVYALLTKPGGYSLTELPGVVLSVIARFL
ncbi:MAG: hypothetical protein OEM24_02375 [Paracoccaceae bacterium]|nr:hypothetical protein [Paracoccaceae bacterium]